MKDVPWFYEEGAHVMYGSHMSKYRELIVRGLYFGFMTITLDYNRTFRERAPDAIILRILTEKFCKEKLRVIAKFPNEFRAFLNIERELQAKTPAETNEALWYATTAVQVITEAFIQLFPKRRDLLVGAYKWWVGDDEEGSPAKGILDGAQYNRLYKYFLLKPTCYKVKEFVIRLIRDTVLLVVEREDQ